MISKSRISNHIILITDCIFSITMGPTSIDLYPVSTICVLDGSLFLASHADAKWIADHAFHDHGGGFQVPIKPYYDPARGYIGAVDFRRKDCVNKYFEEE